MKTKKDKSLDQKTEVKTEEVKETKDVEVINPLEERIASLEKENEQLKNDKEQLKNDYARAYADTENTRKRLNAEAEMNKKYRASSFAKEILPVIDNLERAIATEVESEEAKNYRTGMEMVYRQLMTALKNEGVEEVEMLNKPYDANFAQAIMNRKVEGVESGVVVEVLQKGYKLKDRILRAAMVVVSE